MIVSNETTNTEITNGHTNGNVIFSFENYNDNYLEAFKMNWNIQ